MQSRVMSTYAGNLCRFSIFSCLSQLSSVFVTKGSPAPRVTILWWTYRTSHSKPKPLKATAVQLLARHPPFRVWRSLTKVFATRTLKTNAICANAFQAASASCICGAKKARPLFSHRDSDLESREGTCGSRLPARPFQRCPSALGAATPARRGPGPPPAGGGAASPGGGGGGGPRRPAPRQPRGREGPEQRCPAAG